MPPCLASSSACSRTLLIRTRARTCAFTRTRVVRGGDVRWATSSAAALAVEEDKPTFSPALRRQHLLTILHKTRSLLPRILPSNAGADSERISQDFWNDLLGKAYDSLCPSPTTRENERVRITIFGCDENSGAGDLVTALLDHPFSSDEQREAIRTRWQSAGQGNEIVIQYSPSVASEPGTIRIQSAWLQQFGVPLEIQELKPPHTRPIPDVHIPEEAAKKLLTADILVIVCNPATTPVLSVLSAVENSFLSHSNTLLILTSTSATEKVTERLRSMCDPDLSILCIDPSFTITASSILSSAPSSPAAVQRYQDHVSASRISKFTEAVSQVISAAATNLPTRSVPDSLHAETVPSIIHNTLSACNDVLDSSRREVDDVHMRVSALRGRMEEVRMTVEREVFGTENGENGHHNHIQLSVNQSKKDIGAVMSGLTWWKLLWKVDDIGDIVLAAVHQNWCKDLENRLIYQAGRLASTQSSFTKASHELLASFPPRSPFHSPVLQNYLFQISSAPKFPLEPPALTRPLHVRRQQLQFPTSRLQTTAQRAVLGMGGSVMGGMSIAWAGWAGQLGILNMAVQAETALGIGLLGAVAGVRWAIGRFEKAKKKWWKDYDRIGESLERDLKMTLVETIDHRVLVASENACCGLEKLASKQKNEIEELIEEVESLETQLHV